MTVGSGGVDYEKKVLDSVKSKLKEMPNIKIKAGISTAAFSHEPDLQLLLFGYPVNIEIKENNKAQMGGGSFDYNQSRQQWYSSRDTHIDPIIEKELKNLLKKKNSDVDKLLNFVRNNEMPILAKDINGFPLKITNDFWNVIKNRGLLIPLNMKVDSPVSFLYDHYDQKKCYYIQMGDGAGFFYLKRNPLNLPIPRLNTRFNIEMRLARSGSKYVSFIKKTIVSSNIRAQGRLSGGSHSPYSIDKPDHFEQLFGILSKQDVENAVRRM